MTNLQKISIPLSLFQENLHNFALFIVQKLFFINKIKTIHLAQESYNTIYKENKCKNVTKFKILSLKAIKIQTVA